MRFNPFPMFRTDRAADMIRLLKLFRSSRLTNAARKELARSIKALADDLVVDNWPKPPAPPSTLEPVIPQPEPERRTPNPPPSKP